NESGKQIGVGRCVRTCPLTLAHGRGRRIAGWDGGRSRGGPRRPGAGMTLTRLVDRIVESAPLVAVALFGTEGDAGGAATGVRLGMPPVVVADAVAGQFFALPARDDRQLI